MHKEYYEVPSVNRPLDVRVTVPGSKSITNRALLLSCISKGESRLNNVLFSDDSRHFIDCVSKLGYDIKIDEERQTVTVVGGSPQSDSVINVGSAGTAARFITAMLAAYSGEYTIDASEQMQKRPMKPLFEALVDLGAEVEYLKEEYHLPVKLIGTRLKGGELVLDVSKSSQFLSALLMTGALHKTDLRVIPAGKQIATSYIDITLTMIEQFGGKAGRMKEGHYLVQSGSTFNAQVYDIEPDVSAACYFYAMAVLTGGSALVKGVHLDCMQGDIKFVKMLEQLGAVLTDTEEGLLAEAPQDGIYDGIDVDMNDFSDQTMTLTALAVYAKTPTRIRNIEHIKYQESNRVKAIITELGKMGIVSQETEDGIMIYPGNPTPSLVETYEDHRMAMAFSLIGLRTEGIRIANPSCTAKTFENYFDVFAEVVAK